TILYIDNLTGALNALIISVRGIIASFFFIPIQTIRRGILFNFFYTIVDSAHAVINNIKCFRDIITLLFITFRTILIENLNVEFRSLP
ncbi:hypothetical protein C0075_24725, partial [Rhizobium sp. KAs_5_22]